MNQGLWTALRTPPLVPLHEWTAPANCALTMTVPGSPRKGQGGPCGAGILAPRVVTRHLPTPPTCVGWECGTNPLARAPPPGPFGKVLGRVQVLLYSHIPPAPTPLPPVLPRLALISHPDSWGEGHVPQGSPSITDPRSPLLGPPACPAAHAACAVSVLEFPSCCTPTRVPPSHTESSADLRISGSNPPPCMQSLCRPLERLVPVADVSKANGQVVPASGQPGVCE